MTEHNAICMDIGDQVRMKMDPEARAWGQEGPPNDTIGYVVDYTWATFFETRWGLDLLSHPVPGIYERRTGVMVQWPDGTRMSGGYNIEAVDQEKWKARIAERVYIAQLTNEEEYKRKALYLREARIGDLPETEFWERDILEIDFDGEKRLGLVQGINYHNLYGWTLTKPPHPMREHALYDFRFCDENGTDIYAGGSSCGSKNAKLFKRGNLWKLYHNEPLTFIDLPDEIAFNKGLMRYEEVRNPANKLYKWTPQEALEAVRSGLADGFGMNKGLFFGMPARPSPERFTDRDLGERIRQATIKGFEGVSDLDSMMVPA